MLNVSGQEIIQVYETPPWTSLYIVSLFTGGDQGVLNSYYSGWPTEDISKHLPFIYNLSSIAIYSYLPAFKQ